MNKERSQADFYAVIVGNIGNVYSGEDKKVAESTYAEYVKDSKNQYGRAAGEDVTLFVNGEPEKEHVGSLNEWQAVEETELTHAEEEPRGPFYAIYRQEDGSLTFVGKSKRADDLAHTVFIRIEANPLIPKRKHYHVEEDGGPGIFCGNFDFLCERLPKEQVVWAIHMAQLSTNCAFEAGLRYAGIEPPYDMPEMNSIGELTAAAENWNLQVRKSGDQIKGCEAVLFVFAAAGDNPKLQAAFCTQFSPIDKSRISAAITGWELLKKW